MPDFTARIALLLTGLRDLMAAHTAKLERAAWPVINHARCDFLRLLVNRLMALGDRLHRLHARWRAGTLPAPRKRAPRPRKAPAQPYLRLPQGRAWILRRYPGAGTHAAWLRALFAAPGTAEFLAAAPQAGRLLRPLCRMLGVTPPPVIAPAPRAPRPKRPKPSRPPPGPAGKYPRLNPATYSPGRIPPPPRIEKTA